jgi:capsular polysaccharide transport system permease protein
MSHVLALKTQFRVVHALMLREVKTRFGRQKLGYFWAIVEPMTFVGVFTFVYLLAEKNRFEGMPVTLFFTCGAVPYVLFRDCLISVMMSGNSNRPLLVFPQVTPLDLVLSRFALELATYTLSFTLIILGVAAVTGPFVVEDFLRTYFWLAMFAVIGSGCGAGFAGLAAIYPSVERLVPMVLGRPMLFLSGVLFTAEMLPVAVRDLALINPLLHMTELVRSGFFTEFESAHADPAYALTWVFASAFLGLLIHRGLRNRIVIATRG